jgi:hypothetical protein
MILTPSCPLAFEKAIALGDGGQVFTYIQFLNHRLIRPALRSRLLHELSLGN